MKRGSARSTAFHHLRCSPDEIGQRSADNLLERRVHEIGKTAVDSANLAVKRNGE